VKHQSTIGNSQSTIVNRLCILCRFLHPSRNGFYHGSKI
jgi:hypothetical protein